ncbi:N-formylglutamate amidohydrolase [Bordetella pertussis]|nr:N-formylglutamate amidohydrolase [Bordetella pertussis]
MSTLYTLTRGDAPLVVNIPHGGTWVPAELRPLMQAEALGVPDTDWHVDRLYDFVRARGVTLMAATHSRYVIDLNRDPDGGVLYPGASNTELCPTTRFDGGPVWKDEAAGHLLLDVAARRRQYFDPYHAQLAAELARVQARHGYAVLLDGHSIISHCARFFDGKLPDLNLGTADGASCPPGLQQAAAQALAGGRLHRGGQRTLQGRLDHPPLRAAGRGLSRPAAGNGPVGLHDRASAVPLAAGTRRAAAPGAGNAGRGAAGLARRLGVNCQ